jgi:hypothetical protein
MVKGPKMTRSAFIKIVLFTLSILLTCGAVIWLSPLEESNFYASIIDKEAILKKTPGPRIILIGGSETAFGVDSELIKNSLGYDVVNMGLSAGLGITFVLNEVKEQVKEGDIVIMAFPYSFQDEGGHNILEVLLVYPGAISYIDSIGILLNFGSFQVTLQRRFQGLIKHFLPQRDDANGVYSRKCFNRFGDMVGHLDMPPKNNVRGELIVEDVQQQINPVWEKSMASLNKFYSMVQDKKANFYLTFPPVPEPVYRREAAKVAVFYNWLKSNATFPLLGHPESFIYPHRNFYDTIYHLDREGRELRTTTLIELLGKDRQ